VQTGENSVITLAFRLGWTVSEFMGRARWADLRYRSKNQWAIPVDLREFDLYESPRLSYSGGINSPEAAWWQSALRIVALADALELLSDEFPHSPTIRSWPERIYRLTYRLPEEPGKQQIPKPTEREWLTSRGYYEILEPWCRQVELVLSARHEAAALAFTVGGEIADTYWFMRRRSWGTPRDNRNDSWHELINHQRLNVVIRRLKVFEKCLPSLLGPVLRFSLFRWGIANDLGYDDNHLIIEYQRLWHWFHWWPAIMHLRNRLKARRRRCEDRPREQEGRGVLETLTADDEGLLHNRLHEQARRWQDLILAERLPTDYLSFVDRFHVAWQSLSTYVILLVLFTAGAMGLGYLLVPVLGSALTALWDLIISWLKPVTTQPGTLKESIEVAEVVVPWLIGLIVFVGGVLRGVWHGAAGLYPRAQDWLIRRWWTRRALKKSPPIRRVGRMAQKLPSF
jgi:hypothetical protein